MDGWTFNVCIDLLASFGHASFVCENHCFVYSKVITCQSHDYMITSCDSLFIMCIFNLFFCMNHPFPCNILTSLLQCEYTTLLDPLLLWKLFINKLWLLDDLDKGLGVVATDMALSLSTAF